MFFSKILSKEVSNNLNKIMERIDELENKIDILEERVIHKESLQINFQNINTYNFHLFISFTKNLI